MRAHVFIVNDSTFPSHLQYLFAGTGSKDKDENIALLADIKRVRPGDFVLFYIEATTTVKGGFYGIFKVADQKPTVFHATGPSAMQPALGKKLIYRTLLEPFEVYSTGVFEWEALDKLPYQASDIQWSLIYRKLRGKRGCTPLLPWEAEKLIEMIRDKNGRQPMALENSKNGFDWNAEDRKIIATPDRKKYPFDRTYGFDLLGEIDKKQRKGRAYEGHLQLYFTENIGVDDRLNPVAGDNVSWFGNEVASGVGMQKIDILSVLQKGDQREYRLIELKDEFVQPQVVDQIEHYVHWAAQDEGNHLEKANASNLQPVIVATPRNQKNWDEVLERFKEFNQRKVSRPILYFEFEVGPSQTISFRKVDY